MRAFLILTVCSSFSSMKYTKYIHITIMSILGVQKGRWEIKNEVDFWLRESWLELHFIAKYPQKIP